MLLVAALRKVFWPTIDWTVAILDAVRVVALLGTQAALAGPQDRDSRG